jgi:hypothetical protein
MKICDYGCNRPAVHYYKSGKSCCSENAGGCPEVVRKRSEKRRGYHHSDETKQKLSDARRGMKLPEDWCRKIGDAHRGKRRPPMGVETKQKLSKSNKGRIPWNQGLSAETDIRVKQYVDAQKGQVREGNYVANRDWSGKNNPWYGKSRRGNLSPRFNDNLRNRDFRDYRSRVTLLTEKVYQEYEYDINPSGVKRTKCGNKGFQLDHIYPVSAGFENNVPPELIAARENLQMLSWEDNLSKGTTVSIIPHNISIYLAAVMVELGQI